MAEKKVIELEVKTESLKPLKAQLREAQAEVAALAEKFGATSQEAVQAAKKAAQLKDAIADAKNLTDAYNPDAKFNALSASISGVLNGFQAFEGALGLVGVEGEAVQATLLKVQSAMALTQGINGILEAKEDFANLGKQITGVYEGAVKGFQNMTAAGKVFAITGIGLLITGLSLVITYWDDIRKAVGDVSEEEQKLAEYRRQYAAEQDKQVAEESKGFATLIAQLKASNKGSKERSELISEINKKYGTTLKNLSDEAEFQNQLNQELANYLTYQQAKFRLQKNEEAIVRNLETQSKLKRDLVQAEKDLAKAIQDGAGKTRTTLEEGVAVQIAVDQEASNAAERASERIKKNTKELSDAENRFENYGKAAIYASGQIDKLTYSGKKYVEQNTEVKTSTEKVTKETEKQTEALRDNNQELLDAADAFAEAAKKRRDKTTQEMSDEEQARYDASVYWQNLKLDYEKKTDKEKEQLRKDNLASSINAVQQGFSLIAEFASQNYNQYQKISQAILSNDKLTAKEKQKQLEQNNKLAKHAFDVQKKAAIAGALIDTYKGAASAYASTPGGPIIKAASAALAVAAGLLNVRNIQKQEFEATTMPSESGGGSGAGSGVGASNVITPNFNIVGNAQATNPLAGLGGQPLQAYVVSGDVTTAQSLDRNRINYATFG
jgi:hypothetical protein